MSSKPLILVTNDDGISAPGLRTLIQIMNTIGDVVVVAPDSPQSIFIAMVWEPLHNLSQRKQNMSLGLKQFQNS